MRSRSAKPICRAMTSIGWRLCSIIRRTVSTRRFSTAFAGDWPVSVWNARLNWRGLKCVASTTVSGVWRLPPVTAQTVASEREVGGGFRNEILRTFQIATCSECRYRWLRVRDLNLSGTPRRLTPLGTHRCIHVTGYNGLWTRPPDVGNRRRESRDLVGLKKSFARIAIMSDGAPDTIRTCGLYLRRAT